MEQQVQRRVLAHGWFAMLGALALALAIGCSGGDDSSVGGGGTQDAETVRLDGGHDGSTVVDPDASLDAAVDASPIDGGEHDASVVGQPCGDEQTCSEGETCGPDDHCVEACVPGGCGQGHCGPSDWCLDGLCEGDVSCPEGAHCGDDGFCHMACTADTACDTGLLGVCAAGVTVCPAGADGPTACEPVSPATDREACDGLDDDCDGEVDEDFPLLGQPCPGGEGICEGQGQWVCDAEGVSLTCGGFDDLQGAERCDGLDNDCDGDIDEDFAGLGEVCLVGEGACAAEGRIACAPDAERAGCTASAGLPTIERCDGVDNNCDGTTDEGFDDLGEVCEAGRGECAVQGARVCRADGSATTCGAQTGEPAEELCDGLDNDCDGMVDESMFGTPLTESCYDGAESTLFVGLCRPGERTCDAQAWGECVGQTLPAPESCDLRDNDCDGEADNGADGAILLPCYTGPDGTDGVGRCHAGFAACSFGRPGACEGELLPGVEICDQIDNDCDGEIDDLANPEACQGCDPGAERPCYSGPVGTAGRGVCVEGSQRCQGDGAWGACEGEALPGAEICDGVDNDCDGEADEGIEGIGEVCGEGRGACAVEGLVVCAPDGGLTCSAVALEAQPELCDGVDNDCDGRTDEDFAVGTTCTSGLGLCARNGIGFCADDGSFACDAEPGAPHEETCNRLDDDCDGEVDEGYGVGDVCLVGVGECAQPGVVFCSEGGTLCWGDPGEPAPEVCDGLDNDCDGTVDDGFGISGQCVSGIGACRINGFRACGPDGSIICDGPVNVPQPEICNDIDDDCDGLTDEDVGDGEPCATGLPGRCAAGAFECQRGERVCVPLFQPIDEACDALDNDCDGQIDEDMGTTQCGEGVCARQVPTCVDAQPGLCDPNVGVQPDELCNGLDDDCDGQVDEDAIGDGAACGTGQGGCQREGVARCVDGAMACDAVVGQPEAELCNGLDDDCDGFIDEDFIEANVPCFVGVGACRREAPPSCTDGELGCRAVAGAPVAEVCDGVDNDCDGDIDEGFGSETCGVGACRHAVPNCDGGAVAACDPMEGAGVEICDGVDNDCDGQVDEDVAGLGDVCGSGEGACRRDGVTICFQGAVRCDAISGAPIAEICNGIDDDCDGVADDNPSEEGRACTSGAGECLAEGALSCAAGHLLCGAIPGEAAEEVCDRLDNDCDGDVDEALGVVVCGQGICRQELPACTAGEAPACDPLAGARPEVCNGQDDDCNGEIDEAPEGAGEACAVGAGLCYRAGVMVCADGALVCDALAGAPVPEVCNLEDDDCDGRVDDGLNLGRPCTVGAGACQSAGVFVCGQDDDVVCDAAPAAGEVEVCDGLDNDCDGVADDGLDDMGPCETGGFGVCATGIRACVGAFLACVPHAQPGAEICDGLDNDCDGLVDEGLGQVPCGEGACAQMVDACQNGGPAICDPSEGAVPEICDGLDNDCDGAIDEDPVDHLQPCTVGIGGCAEVGIQRCIDHGLVCDAVPGEPVVELCNAVDDDCDGDVDEFTLDEDTLCFAGVGACEDLAFYICTDGVAECPAVPRAAGVEICDAIDNDCDGDIDEGFDGETCGLGVCRHAVSSCDGGEVGVCDPMEGAGVEICNGLDDDCDGLVDEDVQDLGQPCSAGLGVCRVPGVTTCAEGRFICDAEADAPQVEICDGRDNDCDGDVDEGAIDTGAVCAAGIGACERPGHEQCVAGRLVCDAVFGDPANEICDGVDNDCDGFTDEVPGVVRCGVGVCQRDLPMCTDGAPTVCGENNGEAEVCDGLDNDCDGEIDEGLGELICGVGECARAVPACVGGQLNVCVPSDPMVGEICDGRDNDCDGQTDEDVPGEGEVCANGVGRCRRQGNAFCVGGEWTCDGVPGEPTEEICNGADDDCDGVIDDEAVGHGDPCSVGVGVCMRHALQICEDGYLRCPTVPGPPEPHEICDERDNNCDGNVDEGEGQVDDCDDDGVDDACQFLFGAPDCNNNNMLDHCDVGAPGDSLDCNDNLIPDECNNDGENCAPDLEPPQVQLRMGAEVINKGTINWFEVRGTDNVRVVGYQLLIDDINEPLDAQYAERLFNVPGLYQVTARVFDPAGNVGETTVTLRVLDPNDVDFPELSLSSPLPGAQLFEATMVIGSISDANLVRWTVSYGPAGDEGAHPLASGTRLVNNAPMAVIDPGSVPEGNWFLRVYAEDINQRSRTLTSPFTVGGCEPAAEVCDGADNDCDGHVDEDYNAGAACFVSLGVCRSEGVMVCNAAGNGTLCDAAAPAPELETCNGRDDDCDGDVDEDFALGQACAVGVGACVRDGVRICAADGSGTVCGAEAGAPIDEICDSLDNDCDGDVDEGFPRITCGEGQCFHTVSACDGGDVGACDPMEGVGVEICDGVDNDCDGQVDEDVLNPPAEVCDGVDNDCDGQIDEAPTDVGNPCAVGAGECAAEGVTVCGPDGIEICGAEPLAAVAEVCDERDNDCDGQIDEGEVCPDTTNPTIVLAFSGNIVNPGEVVSFTVQAEDDRGVASVSLTVDGVNVPLDAQHRASWSSDTPGEYVFVATATDAAGNQVTITRSVFVLAPGDVTPPSAVITSPEYDDVVTGRIEFRGTADDENFTYYELAYAPVDREEWTSFHIGREPVVDGVLGVFDPTLVINGMYRVRLRVWDVNQRGREVHIVTVVEGGQKIGNFTMKFVDLSIPVAGVSLTVERVYDSRLKFKRDFGVGWTLNVKSGSVQHNRPEGDAWEIRPGILGIVCIGTGAETDSHFTEIKLSDRERYSFRPVMAGGTWPISGHCEGTVHYEFVGGSLPGDAQLEILGRNWGYWRMGADVFTFDLLDEEPFTVDRVRLTTPDGRTFDLEKVNGTFRIADLAGNSLDITDDGLVHSTGETVEFERDASDRITAIVEPGGRRIEFEYDLRGDLVLSRDADGHETTYHYDANHYLTEVRDPLGNVPSRQEFDDDGRLIAVVDAQGNRQTFNHDLDGRTEVVSDRLGHLTMLQYDERGNVLCRANADGGVTFSTYDADDHKLTETTFGPRGHDCASDPNQGDTTHFVYRADGALLSATNPLGHVESWTYDDTGKLLTHTEPNGGTERYEYDAQRHITAHHDAEARITTYAYDAQGNRVREEKPGGRVTTWIYDARAQLVSVVAPDGGTTRYEYDDHHDLVTEIFTRTDGGQNIEQRTTYTYNGRGKRLSTTDPLGGLDQVAYNARGDRVTVTDAEGHITQRTYDSVRNLVRVDYPDQSFEAYTYDGENRRTSLTDREGFTTRFQYDASGHLVAETRPDDTPDDEGDNPRSLREYNARGHLVREIDELGAETLYERDAIGQAVMTLDPLFRETRRTFDTMGQVLSLTRPDGGVITYAYDLLGRKVRETLPGDGGFERRWTYDMAGDLIETLDPQGRRSLFNYDAVGRIAQATDAGGMTIAFTYDEAGNRTTTTDANGHQTRYHFDALNRQVGRMLPMGGFDQREYDRVGNLVTHTDETHVITTYTYDGMRQLSARETVGEGRETSQRSPGGARTVYRYEAEAAEARWTYTPRGGLRTHQTADGAQLSYDYDAKGRVVGRTSPAGRVDYDYDVADQLTLVSDPDGGITRYTYDLNGRIATIEYPNLVVTSLSYDARGHLSRLETRDGDNVLLAGYELFVSPAGQRDRINELHRDRNIQYAYDLSGHLTLESVHDDGAEVYRAAYEYDAKGNRTRSTVTEGDVTVTDYTYDDADRLIQAGETTFEYNARGDLLRSVAPGGAIDYVYDARRRLVLVDDGAQVIEYRYDLDRNRTERRVGVDIERFVFDGNFNLAQVVQITDDQGVELERYVYGHQAISQRVGAAQHFFGYDAQRSVRQLFDMGGAVVGASDYDAFGAVLANAGVGSRLGYAGEQLDADTGLIYLRERWYQPESGRFTTRDRATGDPQRPRTAHPYTYAGNDPVGYADPSGDFMSMGGMSMAISINMNLQSMYMGNMLKTLFKVNRVVQTALKTAYDMQHMGMEMIMAGMDSGFDVYAHGRQLVARGYKMVFDELMGFYQSMWDDMTTVNFKVVSELEDLVGGVSVNWQPGSMPSWSYVKPKWLEAKEKLENVYHMIDAENWDGAKLSADGFEKASMLVIDSLPFF